MITTIASFIRWWYGIKFAEISWHNKINHIINTGSRYIALKINISSWIISWKARNTIFKSFFTSFKIKFIKLFYDQQLLFSYIMVKKLKKKDQKTLWVWIRKNWLIYNSRLNALSHFSCVPFFVTLLTVACQAPLSMGFSRQESWSRLPCPPPGVFSIWGSNSYLLCLLHCRRLPYPWATGEAPGIKHSTWQIECSVIVAIIMIIIIIFCNELEFHFYDVSNFRPSSFWLQRGQNTLILI